MNKSNLSLSERFVTALNTFGDDPELLDDICMIYLPNVVDVVWNPDGSNVHVLEFDDSTGVKFEADGTYDAGLMIAHRVPEQCYARQFDEILDSTEPDTKEREEAVSKMDNTIARTAGGIDGPLGAAIIFFKDQSAFMYKRDPDHPSRVITQVLTPTDLRHAFKQFMQEIESIM